MRVPSSLFVLVICLLARSSTADVTLSPGKPADVGMSAKKLQAGVTLFKESVKRDEIRGAVVLVVKDGKIVLHEAIGWRNLKKQLPMQRDSLFRMASNTKAIVATAVMMLAQQRKLSIEDPIGKHLPAFANDKYRDVRVKHLLSHTSGLRIRTLFLKPLMKPSKKHPDAPSLQLEVNRFAAIAPKHKPGATFSYNNPGYNTLGALVEVVSKLSLEQFVTKNIYQPLGMKDTSNHPVSSKFKRMCVVYARNRKLGKWTIRFRQNSGMRVPFVRASGGMVSTAIDYARFCQMFLNGGTYGAQRILSKQSAQSMTQAQTKHLKVSEKLKKRSAFYGYGWVVNRDGSFSHGGSEGTYGWIDPQRKLIALVLTQSPGGKIPRRPFIKLVKEACQ